MSARRRRLTPIGEAWHRGLLLPGIQLPDSIVTALIFYDECPSKDDVVDSFEKHVWPLFRCSSRVVDGHFVKVEGSMERSYHFAEEVVEEEAAIDALAQRVMSQPLDPRHPLWTVTVLKAKRGRSAVLMRFHHVIADGLGFLFAFLPMMTCESGLPIDHIPLPAALLGKKMIRQQNPKSRNPVLRLVSGIGSLLHAVVAFTRGIMSLVIVPMDSSIKINAAVVERKPFLRYTGAHTFTRMSPVPLVLVKSVREKHGCTVNDVLMCGLAGAIRRYCAIDLLDPLLRGPQAQTEQKLECKCSMLMALPRPIDPQNPDPSMVNNILTPILRLPIGEPSSVQRLRKTIAAVGDLKSAAFLMGLKAITRLITAIVPVSLGQKIASECISKLTANVTSLPMTTIPAKLFGKEIKEIYGLIVNNVPQVCMVSYNGFVYWNIIADPNLIPDARALGQHVIAELEELAAS